MIAEISSRATSREAGFVARQYLENRVHLNRSIRYASDASGVFDELRSAYEQCQGRNWDGYDAGAVEEETYRYACRLAWALLESETPPPSVGAEADGHLTFEWHRSPRRTLSVSVSPEGYLHYAALLGASKKYGSEPFFGEVPGAILNLIQQVHAA